MAKLNEERVALLTRHGLTAKEFGDTNLKWEDLEAVAADHVARANVLLDVGDFVAGRVRQLPEVHSVKVRVKNPEHLIAKIIRKRIERPDRVIELTNYRDEVTDLIGVRALHLFKHQWKPIHEMLREEFAEHEKPVAYYRKGDPEEVLKEFSDAGCRIEEHDAGYRSVHYVVNSMPQKDTHHIEIQVRTIFEEGWAEIDHLVRYPHNLGEKVLNSFLALFNTAASTADLMGTFLVTLQAQTEAQQQLKREANKTKGQLDQTVAELKISEEARAKLKNEIAAAQRANTSAFVVQPNAGALYVGSSPDLSPLTLATGTGVLVPGVLGGGESALSLKRYLTCPNGHTFSVPVRNSSVYGNSVCPDCNALVWG